MANNNKHTGPNVPALRFPEFSGEWEQYQVSDFLEFYPTNSLSWDQLEYDNGECLNLHYGLIHNGLPVQVDLLKDSLPSIKADFFPKKYTICQDGDIAFADASEDTNDVGKAIEFYNCAGKDVVCGLHTIHGRDKLGVTVPGFKGYLFSSKVFHDQIKTIAQGTKVFSIKASNFDEVFLGIPCKEEQTKISNLLRAIDERISTQSKIIEELKTLRGALRQRLLYHSSAITQPVSSFAELKNGYAFKSNTYSETGDYEILTISNVVGERNIKTEGCNKIQSIPSDLQSHQILHVGDILISMTGNVGRVSMCTKGNYLLNQRVGLLEIKKEYIEFTEFIFQCLRDISFTNAMKDKGQGAAQQNIGKGDIESYEIPWFDDERYLESVSRILFILDNAVIIEEEKKAKFTMQKKWFLAKLFI